MQRLTIHANYIRDPLAPPPDHKEHCCFEDGTGEQKSRMELKHTVDPFTAQAVVAVNVLAMFLLYKPTRVVHLTQVRDTDQHPPNTASEFTLIISAFLTPSLPSLF